MSEQRQFTLTSTQFPGEVIMIFDENGYLKMFDSTNAKLSTQQTSWLVNELPRSIEKLNDLIGNSKTARLTEIVKEITFIDFWDRYDEKIRSSKRKAQARWDKLSKTDQIKAYRFISTYEAHIPPGTCKKYAETYLNAAQWEN